jgi:hypothetical protein
MKAENIISKCCLEGNEFLKAQSQSYRIDCKVAIAHKTKQFGQEIEKVRSDAYIDQILARYFEPKTRPIIKELMKHLLDGYPKPIFLVSSGSNGMSTDIHALIHFFKESSP